MKFLCFSDLHRDRAAAENLVALATHVDCVIGAGDFATCRQGLSDTLDILSQIQQPAVLVPGNGESFEELSAAAAGWHSARVLHGSGCQIDGIDYWGIGGGVPITPFGDWSYDFDEEQAEQMLAKCPGNAVLVTHSPPLNTVDRDTGGVVRGSSSIRRAVELRTPRLVVCGHIHSDWEREVSVGQTRVLNAGPRGVLVQLD